MYILCKLTDNLIKYKYAHCFKSNCSIDYFRQNLMHHSDSKGNDMSKKSSSEPGMDKMSSEKDGIKNGLGGQNHIAVWKFYHFYYTDIKKLDF